MFKTTSPSDEQIWGNNRINNMIIDGTSCMGQQQIKEHTSHFFKDLYREREADRPFFKNLQVNKLNMEKARKLEEAFTKEEVYKA